MEPPTQPNTPKPQDQPPQNPIGPQQTFQPPQPVAYNPDTTPMPPQPAGSYAPPQFQQPVNPYQQPLQPTNQAPAVNAPGLIVLQWLTYAFWGWTIVSMSWLTISIFANYIAGAQTGSFTPYAIAAVLVLLPISIACDFFYTKHEPPKKTGAASVVMVIHAVIFALFGIGALIGIVFSLVTIFTSSSDSSNNKVALFSAMIITVLYAAAFLRTINPTKLPFIKRFYIIFMTAVVGIICVLGLVGPVAHERATRNDRLVESGLGTTVTAINSYATTNKRLPDKLDSLSLSGDSQQIVSKGLVKYTPNVLPPKNTYDAYYKTSSASSTIYYYELCATYTKESKNKYNSSNSDPVDADGYSSYIYSYNDHPAGQKCYKLKTTGYNY